VYSNSPSLSTIYPGPLVPLHTSIYIYKTLSITLATIPTPQRFLAVARKAQGGGWLATEARDLFIFVLLEGQNNSVF
jgi:hypothetical protein